jgi:hypothetical protein
MNGLYASVAAQLTSAGFKETEAGCFTSASNPRVVGLALCDNNPEGWRQKTDEVLRKETMRTTLSWARYVVLLVSGRRTSDLSWSAAAFAQDVSKCRRMVLFIDEDGARPGALPFIGLPSSEHSADAPPRDIEAIVQKCLPEGLVDKFLNEDMPTVRVQELAEEE